MRGFAKRRRTTQPRESSAGCIFKNPQGYYAGLLIEDAGLKGKRIGGAEVSTVHGNFIVNVEDARYGDVVKLVRTVREEVQAAHKLELVPEVELLGTNWDKIL
jgi:UDP-N-acetylenolpyruvoylglucosamine reductase